MFKRDYTLMICSHSSGRVRSLRFSRYIIAALTVFVCSLAVSAGGVAVTLYYNYRAMDRAVRPTFEQNRRLAGFKADGSLWIRVQLPGAHGAFCVQIYGQLVAATFTQKAGAFALFPQ